MSEFLPAFQFMLPHEGGYSFTSSDSGGRTKFGISQSAYPCLNIEELTLEQAQEIYHRDYWLPLYEQSRARTWRTSYSTSA